MLRRSSETPVPVYIRTRRHIRNVRRCTSNETRSATDTKFHPYLPLILRTDKQVDTNHSLSLSRSSSFLSFCLYLSPSLGAHRVCPSVSAAHSLFITFLKIYTERQFTNDGRSVRPSRCPVAAAHYDRRLSFTDTLPTAHRCLSSADPRQQVTCLTPQPLPVQAVNGLKAD